MAQEEKQLLLKDLCARQFYGTKVLGPWEKDGPCELSAIDLTSSRQIRVFEDWFKIEEIKPYLRPISSMTDEEKALMATICLRNAIGNVEGVVSELSDFYNSRHFDFRGLIPMGLAMEAPEGMYKF